MKNNILKIIKCFGIAISFTFTFLILSLLGMGIYVFFVNKNISLPLKLVSLVFEEKNGGFDIEIVFIENFIYQFLLFTTFLAIVIFVFSKFKKTKNYIYVLVFFVAVIIQVFGARSLLPQKSPLINIGIKDVQAIQSQEKNRIIYVGRDNCPDCILYKPTLMNFLNKNQLSINYLDTTGNKSEVEKYRKFYNELGVKSVPSIIIMKKGKIEKIFYGDKDNGAMQKEILNFKRNNF